MSVVESQFSEEGKRQIRAIAEQAISDALGEIIAGDIIAQARQGLATGEEVSATIVAATPNIVAEARRGLALADHTHGTTPPPDPDPEPDPDPTPDPDPDPDPDPQPQVNRRDFFITDAQLASLPRSGAAWDRLVRISERDPGTPTLAPLDNLFPPNLIGIALRWRMDGGGKGAAFVKGKILAAIGTESQADQPLNPYRSIAALLAAASLIRMDDTGFDAWVASLPDKVLPGQENWNTLRKCNRTAGANWGRMAAPSLLAVALWLGDDALVAEVVATSRRWAGDLSVPNTFQSQSSVSPGWMSPGLSYPANQGSINPAGPNLDLAGANCPDASRGSTAPPLRDSGQSYTLESFEGQLAVANMLSNAGLFPLAQVLAWGGDALRRNGDHFDRFHAWEAVSRARAHIAHLANHALGTSYPAQVYPATSLEGARRHFPDCADLLCAPGSVWLRP